MASYDNAYSRFIALAKIVLPLAALGILSTLFLIARDPGRPSGPNIPFSDVDVDELAREQRLGAPNYAGVTSDGTAIAMTAETARPDPDKPGRTFASPVHAVLDLPDGTRAVVDARTGTLDRSANNVVLEGDAVVTTSSGYRMRSQRFVAALDETDLVSDGPVTGDGPPGHLEAGSMRLRADREATGQYLLVFKNGVRLIYVPNR
jgi:lipopolysaccharide export system protein LptC